MIINKKKMIAPIAVLLTTLGIYVYSKSDDETNVVPSDLIDIEVQGSFAVFSYEELQDIADIVALVEVNDNLSVNNSTVLYADEESNDMSGFYGEREVRVIEYFKNDIGSGEILTLIEPAVITEKNEYIHSEDYEKLEKGQQYLVFLSNDTPSKQLSIISASNGKVDVLNPEDNVFEDIALEANEELNAAQVLEEYIEGEEE